MKYIIDRFENRIAVCEDEQKNYVQIPRDRLPFEAKEGDIIHEIDGTYSVMQDESEERKEKMKRKMKKLFE